MTAAAFRQAAEHCRQIVAKAYREQGLEDHAKGAELCAETLDLRADGLALSERFALKAAWTKVCNAMADGYWPGTEAEALAEIERIKSELAKLEEPANA